MIEYKQTQETWSSCWVVLIDILAFTQLHGCTAWLYYMVVLQPICKYYRDGQYNFFFPPFFFFLPNIWIEYQIILLRICPLEIGMHTLLRKWSESIKRIKHCCMQLCLLYIVQLFSSRPMQIFAIITDFTLQSTTGLHHHVMQCVMMFITFSCNFQYVISVYVKMISTCVCTNQKCAMTCFCFLLINMSIYTDLLLYCAPCSSAKVPKTPFPYLQIQGWRMEV